MKGNDAEYEMSEPVFNIGIEHEALQAAAYIGSVHGYGNVVAHLLREWQLLLMKTGLSEEAARDAVSGRTPYPLYGKEER